MKPDFAIFLKKTKTYAIHRYTIRKTVYQRYHRNVFSKQSHRSLIFKPFLGVKYKLFLNSSLTAFKCLFVVLRIYGGEDKWGLNLKCCPIKIYFTSQSCEISNRLSCQKCIQTCQNKKNNAWGKNYSTAIFTKLSHVFSSR